MLLVGLGNPGEEYRKTRHNVGFMIIDKIASDLNLSFVNDKKFKAEIATTKVNSDNIFLIKPQTYMNLSGFSVQKFASYYKISIDDIVVFHDEIDIDLGRVKYKKGGGSAGHNGLKSIDSTIGKEYHRTRIGIGKPLNSGDVASYVLSDFAKTEKDLLENIINFVSGEFRNILSKNFENLNKNLLKNS